MSTSARMSLLVVARYPSIKFRFRTATNGESVKIGHHHESKMGTWDWRMGGEILDWQCEIADADSTTGSCTTAHNSPDRPNDEQDGGTGIPSCSSVSSGDGRRGTFTGHGANDFGNEVEKASEKRFNADNVWRSYRGHDKRLLERRKKQVDQTPANTGTNINGHYASGQNNTSNAASAQTSKTSVDHGIQNGNSCNGRTIPGNAAAIHHNTAHGGLPIEGTSRYAELDAYKVQPSSTVVSDPKGRSLGEKGKFNGDKAFYTKDKTTEKGKGGNGANGSDQGKSESLYLKERGTGHNGKSADKSLKSAMLGKGESGAKDRATKEGGKSAKDKLARGKKT